MTVLGIDPGTKCGWALVRQGVHLASGTWDLRPRRHEGGGMRYLRARRHLEEIINGTVGAVGYEEVRRHMGVDAAHVYGGIVAVVASVCEEREVPYLGVPVGTVKRQAVGKGVASKAQMVAAFVALVGRDPASDDEADALFVALAASAEIG